MKYILLIVALVCAAYVCFEGIRIMRLVRVSAGLVEEVRPFQRTEGTRSMLVLGDSTAAGVGSASVDSVAGRLAVEFDLSVENHAVSGAKTHDIRAQFGKAQKSEYDLILIQIGANDIIRLRSVEETGNELDTALGEIAKKSDRVLLLTSGKVGNAPLFSRFFGWIWNWHTASMRLRFMSVVASYDGAYVDLFSAKDPFSQDPDRYYAPDGLHLMGDGYEFWYEQSRKTLAAKWPEDFPYGQ